MISFAICMMAAALAQAQAPHAAQNVTLHVSAASDLQPMMPLIVAGFEKQTGIHVAVSFGSSSNLAAQIVNGSPADLFFAADFSFAERVVAANLTDAPTPTLYAKGMLVLWERKDGPFQPLALSALTNPALKSVAIANPLTAPYGLAAQVALRRMHMEQAVMPHLVKADSVAQAAEYADTANTQLAFISMSLALSDKLKADGTYIPVPTNQYDEMNQYAVVMRNSAHRTEAHRFLEYVLSGPIQAQLAQHGLKSKDQ